MNDIALEKQNYYDTIRDDMKKKYKNKVMTKILYEERKLDDRTFYMSIKRERFKSNLATDFKMHKLVQSNE